MKKVDYSIGRRHERQYKVFVKDPFMCDFVGIMQSRFFRRLEQKTQVISLPQSVHTRKRSSHTGEVVANSIPIASALDLNINLCLAIAVGHDIGHAPYGHIGEAFLSEVLGKHFHHSIGGCVVAQHVRKEGDEGLNLSFETLEGILYHSCPDSEELIFIKDLPNEYNAVMIADKIAYTFADLNDAIRQGFLEEGKLPVFITELGNNQRERIDTVIAALLRESTDKGYVSFTEGEVCERFTAVRSFMFHEIYRNKRIIDPDMNMMALRKTYEFLCEGPYFKGICPEAALLVLTDSEVDRIIKSSSMGGQRRINYLRTTGALEMIEMLRGKEIDITKPDLEWGYERKARKA